MTPRRVILTLELDTVMPLRRLGRLREWEKQTMCVLRLDREIPRVLQVHANVVQRPGGTAARPRSRRARRR